MNKHGLLIVALFLLILFSQDVLAQPLMNCAMGNGQQLTVGQTHGGNIQTTDEVVSFWFIGQVGTTVHINLSVDDHFDGVLTVYTLTDETIHRENSNSNGGDERLHYDIPITDKFCVLVSGYQGKIGTFDLTLTSADTSQPTYLYNLESVQELSYAPLSGTVLTDCLYPRELIDGVYPATVYPHRVYSAQVYLDINQPDRDELTLSVVPIDFDAVVRIYSPTRLVSVSDFGGFGGIELARTRATQTGYYCITIHADNPYYDGHFELRVNTH